MSAADARKFVKELSSSVSAYFGVTTSPLKLACASTLIFLLLSSCPCPAQNASTYAQAEALVRQGQLDQGIALTRQILESEPRNLKALNLLGIALTSKGDLDDANRQYKKALAIDPGFYHARKNLAINELAQKSVSEARKDFIAALKFAPDDALIHTYLGKIAYSQRDYADAAGHLSKLDVSKDPELASELIESDLHTQHPAAALELLKQFELDRFTDRQQFQIGLALAGREMFQQAIPYFHSVSAKYPESYDSAFNLALCLVEAKQFSAAIEVLRAVADRGHNTAELDNLLAEAYEGNKQTQEAIDTLREATQLAPADENNYIDLAALCTNYNAFKLGLEVIEVGLSHHPQSDRLIFQRGVIYAMTNRFDLAEQDFQLAARLAPEKNLSYVALGVSYMQLGDLPKAIASLRQRIKQKPNDATLHYLLGEALIRSGAAPGNAAFVAARAALERSIKLNAKFAPSHVDLAKIYLRENRLDEGLQHLETARTLDPQDKAAYSQLAIAYRKKGKPEMASAMLAALNKLNDQERNEEAHRKRLEAVGDASSPEATPVPAQRDSDTAQQQQQ